jgi:23S rRNA (uracil1939-C5)-methyltransferase
MADTSLVVGDRIEVSPQELVAGGAALARIGGFPLFVKEIYPGDRALVEVTEVKRGFGRAGLVELIEAGLARKTMPCPVAEECGGCDWTSLRLDHQLEAKRKILLESLRRVGKIDLVPPIRIHASPLNYRVRSRLHAAGGRFGFFAARSNEVVPLPPECEVVGPAVLENLAELAGFAHDSAASPYETFSSVETFETDLALAVAGPGGEGAPTRIRIRNFDYELSTDAFFQVNRHLHGTLIDLLVGLASQNQSRGRALDLYAGVGFFSLPLATLFEEVFAVEGAPVSYLWARRNATPYPAVHVVRDDVERFLSRGKEPIDFILVDPPRAGLTPGVSELISRLAGERICYLSCDPVTLSRDAARLARRGWSLRTLDLVDLFPNTHHIETLSSFERAS